MRIGLVSEFFYPTLGGIQEHLYFFAKELIRLGHEPTIITPHVFTNKHFDEWYPKDVPIKMLHEVGYSLPVYINGSLGRTTVGFGLGRKLKKLMTPENFDLIHVHSPINGSLPVLTAQFATVPLVGTFHSSFAGSKNFAFFRKVLQRQLDRYSAMIAVAPICTDSLRQYFELDPFVIPNGIDTNFFYPQGEGHDDRFPKYMDGKFNVLFVGRADPRNHLEQVIEAFAIAHKEMPQSRLIVAGAGSGMPEYMRLAEELAPGAVEFLGSVSSERPALYRTAHARLIAVARATFSYVLIEAMASGLPTVTTAFEGYEVHGTPGEHFITTPLNDVPAMARELIGLMRDPARCASLGKAARKKAEEFGWSRIAQEVLRVYEKVLDVEGKSPVRSGTPLRPRPPSELDH